ncbi:MAG: arsenate reductase (glutaredoxin) [Deltaproteobacteria bacterium]|nr:arsenate reductase (glutaredoxin) [Deltaproteobacteria bacterium]MBW2386392.1 arsenate reductase (glutaredoxin) [Deltaproteobacteria bacterium]
MGAVVLYHNPKCSKSRGALEILRARGGELEVVEYLSTPLQRADLEAILDRLPDPPAELVRKDAHFGELGLNADDYTERNAVVEILLEHPRLMQRPVAVRDDRAVIGRPSERVLELVG